jgi:hypothetical protein
MEFVCLFVSAMGMVVFDITYQFFAVFHNRADEVFELKNLL